ncbi:DUF2254 domain-containing protein [Erythrobacter litoralis]|uniref:DUF2254 family protein n=1 Tax=Erythrobacter litoralis TaxID=39960 RepID=UPI0024357831|nr:DUF2254 family protein [Erythrobacter litoralis]MDG6077832.1 DUF2254 domain-containing protein [Erythrobacter litoralis]
MNNNPITGLTGWIAHRLTVNYWSLALGAVIASPLFFFATLAFDRDSATDWLLREDLAPVATADTARDLAGVVAGIDAAFITLYFSISLLVLTIAAGNLGVRLVDRWLAKKLVRISIAGLSFTLIYAVLTMAAIDPDAELADTPLFCFALTIFFLLVNIAMLAVALHDLGRTIFVDKEIDQLAADAKPISVEVEGQRPFSGTFAQTILAPKDGYVEGIELDKLEKHLADLPGAVRVCVAPGQHVFENQTIAMLENECSNPDFVRECIPIGNFRSDNQGTVFQIRLLVEIAARAMSPAVNDFWTAMVAADAICEVLQGHRGNWIDELQIPVRCGKRAIELPGQDFRGLFEDPLAEFRQAAADYPSVSIRMIGNIARMITQLHVVGCPAGLRGFLRDYAEQLANHAQARAQTGKDREDIGAAFANVDRMMMEPATRC